MNLQEKINELEEKFGAEVSNLSERFDKEIRELRKEAEQEESQEWVPRAGEVYYYVDTDIMKDSSVGWYNNNSDNTRLQHKVIFKTEAEAEEYLKYLKAKEKAMNEFSKEEWENDNIEKHCIQCNYVGKNLTVNHKRYCKDINTMYFRTKELAQDFINKYEKILRRELGV